MRVVLQRVQEASVSIDGKIHARIGQGLLVLLGIHVEDQKETVDWLMQKIVQLRIFSDETGKMNKSIMDVNGEILLVSQFTLYSDATKGNRPSFIEAAKPEIAITLYEYGIQKLNSLLCKDVKTGVFGADMKISLINDGPVTIVLERKY